MSEERAQNPVCPKMKHSVKLFTKANEIKAQHKGKCLACTTRIKRRASGVPSNSKQEFSRPCLPHLNHRILSHIGYAQGWPKPYW